MERAGCPSLGRERIVAFPAVCGGWIQPEWRKTAGRRPTEVRHAAPCRRGWVQWTLPADRGSVALASVL